tara:strand:- start:118 stop:297 length:180 start_codon:yes stop_codon:yes gene_type:complete
MLRPFKITKNHLTEFEELSVYDVGMYAIKVRPEQPLLVYETKHIASKAYEYFSKIINRT